MKYFIVFMIIGLGIPIANAQYLGDIEFYHLSLTEESAHFSILSQSIINRFTGVFYDNHANSLIFSISGSNDFIDTVSITMNKHTFLELLATDYAKTPDSMLVLINGIEQPYKTFDDDETISWRFSVPPSSNEIELIPSTSTFSTGTYAFDDIPTNIPRIYPPLKQDHIGVVTENIQCKDNLILLQKYDGTPACVTESTKTKLIERGWTTQGNQIKKTTTTPYCKEPLYVLDNNTNTCITNEALPKCTDNTTNDTAIQHCIIPVTCDKEYDSTTMQMDVSLLPQCKPLRECPNGFLVAIFPVDGGDALCEREDRNMHIGIYHPYDDRILNATDMDTGKDGTFVNPVNLNGSTEQRTIQIIVMMSGWYEKLENPTAIIDSNGELIEQFVLDLKKNEPGQAVFVQDYVLSKDLSNGTVTVDINMSGYESIPQSFSVKHIANIEPKFLSKTITEWKSMPREQLVDYHDNYPDNSFFSDLGRFLIKDAMKYEMEKHGIQNKYDDFTVYDEIMLTSLPPHAGFSAVVNATDQKTYLLGGSVFGNVIENGVHLRELVFYNVLNPTDSKDVELPYNKLLKTAPQVSISQDTDHIRSDPPIAIFDLEQSDSVVFHNDLEYLIRIQAYIPDDMDNTILKSGTISPNQTGTVTFENIGMYEYDVLGYPDNDSGLWEQKGGGEIIAISQETKTLPLEEKLEIARSFLSYARYDIPFYSIGIGNGELSVGITHSVEKAIPDYQEYYEKRIPQWIPFEIPLNVE